MKYIFTLTLSILALTISAQSDQYSQKKQEKREKMHAKLESKKIGYITKELDLSPEEAQKFWPIYNEFTSKIKTCKKENLPENRDRSKDLSEKEAEEILNGIFEKEQKELDLRKEYFGKLEGVITKSKIVKLFFLEKRFKAEVFDSVKRKMRGSRKEKTKEKK